jgi:ubiquinone/menaquinone biosynthesis C-methylase UbiE
VTDTAGDDGLYSYEPFTRHGFYAEVNRVLVRRAVELLPDPSGGNSLTVVDLGCGTGAVTRMVAEEIRNRGIRAMIVGIDPSAAAVEVARRGLTESPDANVRFLRADVAGVVDLAPVDAVFFCNAIHLVRDKDDVLERVGQALVRRGLFAMNSAFSTGAYAPGTERFYRLWTARAMRHLRRAHPDVRLARGDRAPAMEWISPEDYQALLHRHGFEVTHCSLDEAHMTLESFRDIGHYSLFIEGALPGIPLDAGADALGVGAGGAFEELGLEFVPRRWLQMVATKDAAPARG